MFLLLEFIGTLLICTTAIVTHGDPIFIGLAHTAALFIARGKVESQFNPLSVLLEFSENRMTLHDSILHLLVQCSAVLALVVARKGI
jgi:hypothetical protein